MKDFSRRTFLRLCGKCLLGLGLGSVLPPAVARAAEGAPELHVIQPGDAPADAGHFRAIVFCDSQCGESYDTWAHTFTAAFDRHGVPDFFTVIGDLIDCGASDWHWSSWQEAMDSRASSAVFVPVMGNHECYSTDWLNCLPEGYLSRFAVPANGSARFPGYYYSFDYGPAHVLVLNTQWGELDNLLPGILPEQIAWMQADLAAQKKAQKKGRRPWNIVLMHKDILAYDEPQADGQTAGFSDVGRAFMQHFDALGIDLVLTGHMHAYRDRGHIKSFHPAVTGPAYVMCGRAGNEYYYVPPDKFDRAAAPDDHPESYVTLDVTETQLTLRGWETDGTLLDTLTLARGPQNPAS